MGRLMARRSKRKSPRKTQTNLSLTGVAQSYIVGSAMTKAFTGNNLMEFVTGVRGGNFNPGADGGQNISLPEILGIRKIHGKTVFTGQLLGEGHFGSAENRFNYQSAVKHNLRVHGAQALTTAVMVPVGVKVFRRLASRSGVTRYVNKAFKMTGLPVRM
jgi:hypothetical protein